MLSTKLYYKRALKPYNKAYNFIYYTYITHLFLFLYYIFDYNILTL
jgi:hypothetical protein